MGKRKTKTTRKKADLSTSKIMFLSIILLFIVFEALYIVKGQNELARNNSHQQVAGARTTK